MNKQIIMKNKNFTKTAGTIFVLVAIMHLWIATSESVLVINGTELGSWINWLAFIVTGYMAMLAFKITK